MSTTLSQLMSLSILLAAGIAAVRFRTADSAYFPFILLLWIGSANEILSIVLMNRGFQTAVNNNVYVLLESLLILRIYQKFRGDEGRNKTVAVLQVLFVVFWLAENFLFSKITRIGSYYRIFYSFTTVLLFINLVNHFLFRDHGVSLKSPSFLICVCFIVFFTYKILVEAFWLYGLNNSKQFRTSVYTLLIFLNFVVNLVFAVVALWIPKKQKPLLLY